MISHGKNVKVFCANANRPFAEGVCRKLWLPLGDCTVTTFADGEVSVTITGRSSHIAKAEEGLDALAAGVEFYRRAVALEKELSPDIYRLLKFGRMESGTVRNAVSGKTVLLGSLRAFQDEVFFGLQEGLRAIGRDIEKETGCTVDVHANDGYPAVWNPDELFDRVRNAGVDFEILDKPVMISEDFSWYQRHLPALFFFLGCGPAPALPNGEPRLLDANSVEDLARCDAIITCQGGDYTKALHPKLRDAGWKGYWIDAASALRMDDNAVIILDPVNDAVIRRALSEGGLDYIGGNCTVSLMLMAMDGLIREAARMVCALKGQTEQ